MTEKEDWIWPKLTNPSCSSMPKKWQRWMIYVTGSPRETIFIVFIIFGHIHTIIFIVVAIFIVFRIFGYIHTIIFMVVAIFQSSSKSQFLSLSVFGHVQILWSNSFSHIESAKLTTLNNSSRKLDYFHITTNISE